MKEPVIFITKLGPNKGTPRSRIWIEGKRLADHQFTVGTKFTKDWGPGSLTLKAIDKYPEGQRLVVGTVSGKGTKPIIDIVGAMVSSTFTGTHVVVEFHNRKIAIRGSNQ